MTETVKLRVGTVIGTGDPLDRMELLPLIVDWRVPSNCLWSLAGTPCEKPLSRLYVLDEPLQGHRVVGVCEQHHVALGGPVSMPDATTGAPRETPPAGSLP